MSSLLLLLACAEPESAPLLVLAPEELVPLFQDHLASLPHDSLVVEGTATPVGTMGELTVTVELDTSRCVECFIVETTDTNTVNVSAGGTAGSLYGLAAAMEAYGWRFAHPFNTVVPSPPALAANARVGVEEAPEMSRRGYHPHTLHPIEAMYDVWGAPDVDRGKAMLDWVVRNRGNYIQYPGLDDISADPLTRERWSESTEALIAAAHAREMQIGLGVQLFGLSNLQLAFDLLDDSGTDTENEAAMLARWEQAVGGLAWDEISLSFGEFFSAEPEVFIASVEQAYDTLQEVSPGTAMNAVIHVGGNEEVQVEYDGKSMTYYFLATYTERPIEPFVHTVMYYNLVEDAGGAYGLDAFTEHEEYLQEALAAGEQVTYFPESAYWVAFDNSVPTFLPLYVNSRWLDMQALRDQGLPLDRHVLFASGWEWGYWLNDAATLRMNYRLPESPEAAIEELYANPELAATVAEAMGAQAPLIAERLAPYLAGRDVAMDIGDGAGIWSQPRRVLFDEVAELTAEERAALRTLVVQGLARFADAHDALGGDLGSDAWSEEVAHGLAANSARARYIAALYDAVLLAAEGADPSAALAEADSQLESGAAVVALRHAALHDPEFERLLVRNGNPTLYDYGYLTNADTLCFWQRERVQVRKLLLGEAGSDPGCTL